MNPISIASYSVHGLLAEGKIDLFGYLESCRYRYDLRTADIWNGLMLSLEPEYLQKVRQGMTERELTLVNYHVDGVHLWEDDAEAREKNRTLAVQHLQAAAFLGAKTVRFDTGGKVEPISQQQLDLLAERYREYCEFGAVHGFRVGPETHWGLSLLADNMEQIARAVDHHAYGILLHIDHWEQGDIEEANRRLAPWTMHTHVDARVTRTCLKERMQMLLDAGYTGCWGVEHHSARREYAEIDCQLAAVRRAAAELTEEAQISAHIPEGNPLLTVEQERRG